MPASLLGRAVLFQASFPIGIGRIQITFDGMFGSREESRPRMILAHVGWFRLGFGVTLVRWLRRYDRCILREDGAELLD